MDYDYLKVGDGTGDAALMHITADRSIGSLTIAVDTVSRIPTKFIATTGTLLPSGLIDPATKRDFKGHKDGSNLAIDGFMPGSTDAGNTTGQVVVIKPNTPWAQKVATFIMNATGNGTPEAGTFAALTASAITAVSAALSGALTVGGNATITGNIVIAGTSRVTAVSVASADGSGNITPTAQIFNVTALAANATVLVPTFGVADGISGELQIIDNGTARSLTWPSGWAPIGVTLPTATVPGKVMYISYRYNAGDSKFHVRGVARQA